MQDAVAPGQTRDPRRGTTGTETTDADDGTVDDHGGTVGQRGRQRLDPPGSGRVSVIVDGQEVDRIEEAAADTRTATGDQQGVAAGADEGARQPPGQIG